MGGGWLCEIDLWSLEMNEAISQLSRKPQVNDQLLSPQNNRSERDTFVGDENGDLIMSVETSGVINSGLESNETNWTHPLKCVNTSELSSSLPNLSGSVSEETFGQVEVTANGCGSLNCIRHGPMDNSLTSDSEVNDSSFTDLIKKRGTRTLSLDLEDCPSCSVEMAQSAASFPENAPKTKIGTSPTEITINVGPNNNRLSAVLESIPLIYLPQTRQLISVNGDEPKMNSPQTPTVDCTDNPAESAQENSQEVIKSKTEIDETIASLNTACESAKLDNDNSPSCSHLSPSSDQAFIESVPSPFSEKNSQTVHLNDTADDVASINSSRVAPSVAQTFLLTKDDRSSFSSVSSVVSTGTDLSISATSGNEAADENGFVEISLSSRDFSSVNLSTDSTSIDTPTVQPAPSTGAKPKRKGLSSLLPRGLFSRKPREIPQSGVSNTTDSQPSLTQPTNTSYPAQDQTQLARNTSSRDLGNERVKKIDVEVSSTTALILEQRPHGLPSKDPEEEERHRQEYESMVEAARRKEQRDVKQKKKQLQRQLRHEEEMAAAVRIWNTEILPNWDTMMGAKKTRDLMWVGIPPCVRGKVWRLALGNDLNLTQELYEICVNRAQDRLKLMREAATSSDTDSLSSFSEPSSSKEASVDLIRLDVSRTFPQLCIFQKGGPLNSLLQGLLGAYACYRPDVGYVQGMSFIAAVLLLNMEVDEAFICFANLLNRPCQVAFFRLDELLMKSYFETYEAFFEENLPKLLLYFKKLNVTPDLYIIDWMFTLYAKSLPLDVASRVWDMFCRDGEEFLFRTALGILRLYEDDLMNLDFIHLAQFLTRLPENMASDKLFKCIDKIHMTIDNLKFNQVLAKFRES